MHFAKICATVHCCWSYLCVSSKLLNLQSLLSGTAADYVHCHDLCCSALLLVIVPLCEQQTFTNKLAVKRACCQAVVCTAALISEGCTLAGSVLQCTLAGRIAFV